MNYTLLVHTNQSLLIHFAFSRTLTKRRNELKLPACRRYILLCVKSTAIVILLSSTAAFAERWHTPPTPPSQAESDEIDAYLRSYHKGLVVTKTTTNIFGDVLSCVDIHQQPGLRGSAMKGHQVQLEPSPELKAMLGAPVMEEDYTKSPCPKGEVAVILPTREQILRFGSLKKFLSNHSDGGQGRFNRSSSGIQPAAVGGHEYAITYQWVNATASLGTFNVWKPAVEWADEFSLTQSWLVGGAGTGLQTLEVGVNVYEQLYGNGNTSPHLFVLFTANGYAPPICYNVYCANTFVQTSNIYTVGATLPFSVSGGTQVEGALGFYRDPASPHNWILFYFDGVSFVQVGYYPVALFNGGQLTQSAEQVQFGGEILSQNGVRHTKTDMGSGAFANAGNGVAAYIKKMQYMDLDGGVHDVAVGVNHESVTNSNCYSILSGTNASWGSYMYFGGPGYDPQLCPN